MKTQLCDTDRGVSSPLGYILNLGIAGIVLVSLGAVGLVFFETNETTGIESELQVYGNELAGEIEAVDRLAREAGPAQAVGERASLGEHARNDRYLVTVINRSDAGNPDAAVASSAECDRACLVLTTQDGSVQTKTNFVTETPVESGQFDGGPVYVNREPPHDTIRFEPLG